MMSWKEIQPSQLYLNIQKLSEIENRFQFISDFEDETFPAIPIKKRNGRIFYTDGHHRAFVAYRRGLELIPVEWDEDELDWELYDACVTWCDEKNIRTIADLEPYIVDAVEYKKLWFDRCQTLAKDMGFS